MNDKEIKNGFQSFLVANPNFSSVICFGRFLWTTPKAKWTKRKIAKYFRLLVEKDDYNRADEKSLIKWLCDNHALDK